MTKAQKQIEYLAKASAMGILASTALFGQSGALSTQVPDAPKVTPIGKESPPDLENSSFIPQAKSAAVESSSTWVNFTGKVQVHCAPLRASPQAEAIAVMEVERATLLQITGKEGDFYQVLPPDGLKAYIASRYVNNHSVVGQHVNIRSRPNTESAILGQVNTGDAIKAAPLMKAPDWMELPFPADRKLYIRADLIKRVAGNESFEQLQQLRGDILKALTEAQTLNAEAQRQLIGDNPVQISWTQVRACYEKAHVLASRSEAFSELAQSADQQLQEAFLKYQTSFSEVEQAKKAHLEPSLESKEQPLDEADTYCLLTKPNAWAKVEQLRCEQWLHAHPEKTQEHYALDQQGQSLVLEGTPVNFARLDLRQKPGDFILMRHDLPVAYLYSARIDLEQSKGKNHKFRVVKRDDLGFALPAYCVISIQE